VTKRPLQKECSGKANPVRFRPHHFLCALGFRGKGYSDGFTANMHRIVVEGLRAPEGEGTVIEITRNTDDICAPCPKRIGLRCRNQEQIETLDQRHLRALQLEYGQKLSWGEALDIIRSRVAPDGLQIICSGCQWLELGLCKEALEHLRNERQEVKASALADGP